MQINRQLHATVLMMSCCALLMVCKIPAAAQTEILLHSFTHGTDGGQPFTALVMDTGGNLYGTTEDGGQFNSGVAFELRRVAGIWSEKVIHTFAGRGAGGAHPNSALVLDSQGNLYGATSSGGGVACLGGRGCGTIFQLTHTGSGRWEEHVLYSFLGGIDGSVPQGIVFDSKGNLFGTTYYGGTANFGTVFQLIPQGSGPWKKKLLHSFIGGSDGAYPLGDSLIFDSDGSLYGTSTVGGGVGTCLYGGQMLACGTVFKLTPPSITGGAWTESVLYAFTGGTDGGLPFAGLILDSTGNLYGTTYQSGDSSCGSGQGCGTAFEMSPVAGGDWSYTVLHTFVGGNDGQNPIGRLAFDLSGNLYGETEWGGTKCDIVLNCGTVFELSPIAGGGWSESVFYDFKGDPIDGAAPGGGLVFDNAGNMYGTTALDGTSIYGTAFEITP
jgi:uncharacterized repeat protein (TIGR03803 family)